MMESKNYIKYLLRELHPSSPFHSDPSSVGYGLTGFCVALAYFWG